MLSKSTLKMIRRFGSHEAKAVYDWRDDPKFNVLYNPQLESIEVDPRKIQTPYLAPAKKYTGQYVYTQPDNPHVVFDASAQQETFKLEMPPPYNNLEDSMAHEQDHMSEDYFYTPEHIAANHFRRRGSGILYLMWAGLGVFVYVWMELFNSKFPDENYFKKPLPPPLNFPNEELTPDTKKLEYEQTKEFQMHWENGSVDKMPYKIINGKKVYNRFAGVNQPMEFI